MPKSNSNLGLVFSKIITMVKCRMQVGEILGLRWREEDTGRGKGARLWYVWNAIIIIVPVCTRYIIGAEDIALLRILQNPINKFPETAIVATQLILNSNLGHAPKYVTY